MLLLLQQALPALLAATGTITGLILDGGSGKPLAEVWVNVLGPEAPIPLRGRTDREGRFRIEEVPPGKYMVRIVHRGFAAVEESPFDAQVVVRAGETAQVERKLTPGVSIEGRLVDEEGRPVAGAQVKVAGSETKSDAAGRFRLADLPPGEFEVSAGLDRDFRRRMTQARASGAVDGYPYAIWYPDATEVGSATKLTLRAGARLEGIELRARRIPLASVSGVAIDEQTGQPARGGTIALDGVERWRTRAREEERPLGPQGDFRFDLLPPGEYRLSAHRSAGANGAPAQVTVTVGPGGAAGVLVTIPKPLRLRGRVKGWRKEAGRATLTLSKNNGYARGAEAEVNEAGEFTFEGVLPGEWNVGSMVHLARPWSESPRVWRVTQGGRPPRKRATEIEVAAGSENEELVVEFANSYIVSGVALDASGQPWKGGGIVVFQQGEVAHSHLIREDGSFRIDLFAGEYRLSTWPTARGSRPTWKLGECAHTQTVKVTAEISTLRSMVCPAAP